MPVARGWVEEEMSYLMETKFQFGKRKKFWRWTGSD